MTENKLKKLKRADLLEMLISQSKENETLREELSEALGKLSQKEITISKAGSIAEASLALNGVFEAAENAGAQYLKNIERLSSQQESICARMADESERKARKLLSDAHQKCQSMEDSTKEKCEQMLASAQQETQKYWDATAQKLEAFYETHKGLKELLAINAQRENTQ